MTTRLAVLSIMLATSASGAAVVPVRYDVDQAVFRKALAETPLTFGLYADAACTTLLQRLVLNVGDVDSIERVRGFRVRKGPRRRPMLRLNQVLADIPDARAYFLRVDGLGIEAVGRVCQPQFPSPPSETAPALAVPCLSQVGHEVYFTGCNVNIRSGTGTTDAQPNGLGNLIVGYNGVGRSGSRSGSHNVVIGDGHTYSSYGGLVAGFRNDVGAPWASVSGGTENGAEEFAAAVSGGKDNYAFSVASSVSGGIDNSAQEVGAAVSGGQCNVAGGTIRSSCALTDGASSISGGALNSTFGTSSSVSGGECNFAGIGLDPRCPLGRSVGSASVSGGFGNVASGHAVSVSGGHGNMASGDDASVSGGEGNIAGGTASSVSGGLANRALDEASAVCGGGVNVASNFASSVSGGTNNRADGHGSSVAGGSFRSATGPSDWRAGELFEDF